MIDVVEQELINISEKVFNTLLMDRSTKKNICWATDLYMSFGHAYYPQEPITKELITGDNTQIISGTIYNSDRNNDIFQHTLYYEAHPPQS